MAATLAQACYDALTHALETFYAQYPEAPMSLVLDVVNQLRIETLLAMTEAKAKEALPKDSAP
jgi:alcohol dehydrogenase class IV